jgi:hypothetical protein
MFMPSSLANIGLPKLSILFFTLLSAIMLSITLPLIFFKMLAQSPVKESPNLNMFEAKLFAQLELTGDKNNCIWQP